MNTRRIDSVGIHIKTKKYNYLVYSVYLYIQLPTGNFT